MAGKPIAILYEHPEWFKPLFAELERRKVPHERLLVRDVYYDPAQRESSYSLVVNRVSAYPSGGSHPQIVLFVQEYLAYLDSIQAKVINGWSSYLIATSKAMQLHILEQLGLGYPRARVIHHPHQAVAAAAGLSFPLLVKPNIGGSGNGILKFNSPKDLISAVDAQALDLGIDHTGLVQEYLPAEGNRIVRVEMLNSEFLYAISLPITDDSFNYCPADGCHVGDPDLEAEPYTPPAEVIEEVKQILASCRADLGSVEYLVSQVDGQVYYYDVNPLSNFVANARDVLGFDPHIQFVDFILEQAGL